MSTWCSEVDTVGSVGWRAESSGAFRSKVTGTGLAYVRPGLRPQGQLIVSAVAQRTAHSAQPTFCACCSVLLIWHCTEFLKWGAKLKFSHVCTIFIKVKRICLGMSSVFIIL